MCIQRVRDGEKITVHANPELTKAGARHYIHAADVADALYFLLVNNTDDVEINDFGGAKHQKFNIVGGEEIDNLELAQMIADIQGRELDAELVDFHQSRPGHDLRYALDGSKMARMGWTPRPVRERMKQVVEWTLANDRWMA